MCANGLDVLLDVALLLFGSLCMDIVEIGGDGCLGVDDEIAITVEFHLHVGNESIAVVVRVHILGEEVRSFRHATGFEDVFQYSLSPVSLLLWVGFQCFGKIVGILTQDHGLVGECVDGFFHHRICLSLFGHLVFEFLLEFGKRLLERIEQIVHAFHVRRFHRFLLHLQMFGRKAVELQAHGVDFFLPLLLHLLLLRVVALFHVGFGFLKLTLDMLKHLEVLHL